MPVPSLSSTALSGLTGTTGGGMVNGVTSPEVVKQMVQLERKLKTSEGILKEKYNEFFNVMGVQYAKMENNNAKLTEIVDYLRQYASLMREWEEQIKSEQLFIQRWKEIRKCNSRHMSLQFMEWNHFVTQEVDIFHKTIGLYSVNIFHKVKEKANEFMAEIVHLSNRRNADLEEELKLLNNFFNAVRQEDHEAGDDLWRMQAEMEKWIAETSALYHVYFEYRLKVVVIWYIGALEFLLNRFDDDSELGILLHTLDTMYDPSMEANSGDDERELRKSKALQDNSKFLNL